MFLVGLTGGVATGKSTVGKMFLELGVPVIDADLMARKVVEPGRPAWKKIRAVCTRVIIKEYRVIMNATRNTKCRLNREAALKLMFKSLQEEAEPTQHVRSQKFSTPFSASRHVGRSSVPTSLTLTRESSIARRCAGSSSRTRSSGGSSTGLLTRRSTRRCRGRPSSTRSPAISTSSSICPCSSKLV